MKLDFITLDQLKISPINVRKHGDISGADLVPSIKANGVIQPLLVRPNCEGYEVIAGQRRFNACQTIAKDQDVAPIPCAIMEKGDDEKAIEASLAENIARLPMDELDQYEAFLNLSRCGQSVDDIADHFGVTTRLVQQRLAIACLYDPILNAYRKEEIDPSTIRQLTMASTKQQKAWFKLFKDGEEPRYNTLKSWLFGGDTIPTDNALFDLDTYQGVIIADLFGDEKDSYFADSAKFWEHQSKAIAEIKADLEDEGWCEVILLDVGEHWQRYQHEKVYRENGGKVYIQVYSDGEVKIHAGFLPEKEAKRLALAQSGKQPEKVERPELTKSMQNYLDLHRHAAVRAELLKHQGTALRLAVAQIIAGSSLWIVTADPQRANTEAIGESLSANTGQHLFATEKALIRELLGITDQDEETPLVPKTRSSWRPPYNFTDIFIKLQSLDDKTVMRVLAFIVSETLPCGSEMVECLGDMLAVDMADHHKPDDTFFELLRDKEAINGMLEHIGGKAVANSNLAATAKVQKGIIQDFTKGQNGRKAKPDFEPRYFRFPMQGYTKRQNTIEAVKASKALKKRLKSA